MCLGFASFCRVCKGQQTVANCKWPVHAVEALCFCGNFPVERCKFAAAAEEDVIQAFKRTAALRHCELMKSTGNYVSHIAKSLHRLSGNSQVLPHNQVSIIRTVHPGMR